jgi:hypothetical protein
MAAGRANCVAAASQFLSCGSWCQSRTGSGVFCRSDRADEEGDAVGESSAAPAYVGTEPSTKQAEPPPPSAWPCPPWSSRSSCSPSRTSVWSPSTGRRTSTRPGPARLCRGRPGGYAAGASVVGAPEHRWSVSINRDRVECTLSRHGSTPGGPRREARHPSVSRSGKARSDPETLTRGRAQGDPRERSAACART